MTKVKRDIACAANAILWLWHQDAEVAKKNPWYKADARQAYRDSVRSMQFCGLIEDYDMVKIMVKIDGEWTGVRKITENKQ